MICSYFIPLLMDLREQSITLEIEKKARQILYEEMQAALMGLPSSQSYPLIENEIEYQLYWLDEQDNNPKEVCVSADGKTIHSKIKVCRKLE